MLKSLIPKENYKDSSRQEGQVNYYRFYNNEDDIPLWSLFSEPGIFTTICGKNDNDYKYTLNTYAYWSKEALSDVRGWREVYAIMPCNVAYNAETKELVQINSLEDLISNMLKNVSEDVDSQIQTLLSQYQKLTKEEFLKQTSEKGYLPQ